jgi:putative peptide zinc metalloprotease protein
MNWQEMTYHFIVSSLSPYNLIQLFILYPFIKILHELGHAFSAKLEGGEVHEMGIMFVLFFPIPYVNVSTATNFRNKYKRILVSAAGIIVELFLAALAMFIWMAAEPGLVRDIAFNIMLIGGVSSLFFNGNPLLKYDGYYILADAIDIPNLFQRSAKYWEYLCQKYLLGLKDISSPAYLPGETVWFVAYSIASFSYRMAILWFIIVYVTQKFLLLGILLALWLVAVQFLVPLLNALHFIATSSSLQTGRMRGISSIGAVIGIIVILVFMTPFPSYTLAEGVVWLPENVQLKAESDGFSGPLLINPNNQIQKGMTAVQLEDPFLNTQVEIRQAKLRELEANYRAEKFQDLVKAQMLKDKIPVAESELELAEKKMDSMQIKTKTQGRLLIPDADDLAGKFVKKGDLIGYVFDNSPPIVRTAVPQKDIGKLRAGTTGVQIRLANNISRILPAKIIRETPEATERLPSAALASTAGGKMILDPNRKDELIALEKFFLVDVQFQSSEPELFIGARAYVRFDHGREPLARQLYRNLRQVFLRSFNV